MPISILIADIDGLKGINDDKGHQEGDKVIQAISNNLISRCRPTDIVARWGGDEFIVILPKTNHETAMKVAMRLNHPVLEDALPVTSSCGIATKTEVHEEFPDIIRLADERMYEAKRKNQRLKASNEPRANCPELSFSRYQTRPVSSTGFILAPQSDS